MTNHNKRVSLLDIFLLLIILFLFSSFNHQQKHGNSKGSAPQIDTLLRQLDSPEKLIDIYYKAISKGNLEQIAVCFGQNTTYGLYFPKQSWISYKIISKEISRDTIMVNTLDSNHQLKVTWKRPDYFIKVEASFGLGQKPELFYFLVGKEKNTWIIMGHSSEAAENMEDDEMKATENATRLMDSIIKRDNNSNNK
jgi:hypothetical protein